MQRLKDAIKRNPKLMRCYRKAYSLNKIAGRLIHGEAYMDWSYLVLDDQRVIYIVMQKVACTSIKASMTGVRSDEDYMTVNHTIRKTGHVLSRLDPAKHRGYYVFTFVRNPFERLISCYENKFHTDRVIQAANDDDVVLKFDAYLCGYLSADRGFRSFARRVCHIPDRVCDHHFVSQSFLIDRMGENPKPDFVGHFEHLQEEFEPIREKFGFMPLPHHNRTPKAKNWMDYYDLRTARMVYRRYQEDITRFGYQDTYEELIWYLSSKQPNP